MAALKVKVACSMTEADGILFEELRQQLGVRTSSGFVRMLILRGLNELRKDGVKVSELRAMYRVANVDLMGIYRRAFEETLFKVPNELDEADLEERVSNLR